MILSLDNPKLVVSNPLDAIEGLESYITKKALTPVQIGEVIWRLKQHHYIEKPVEFKTFCEDPYFLGTTLKRGHLKFWQDIGETLYPHPMYSPYFEVLAETPIGSAKCLKKGTRVSTSRGLIPIETIRVGDLVQTETEVKPVLAVHSNGFKNLVKITLKSGKVIEGSSEHKFRVLNDQGSVIWKPLGDLELNDYMITQQRDHCLASAFISDDIAYSYGIFSDTGVTKRVPECIFTSCKSGILSYISGLIDTCGIIFERSIRLLFSHEFFAKDVQELLSLLGCTANISNILKDGRVFHYVDISDYISFNNLKDLDLRDLGKSRSFKVICTGMQSLVAVGYSDYVVSIESSEGEVYDLSIKDDHSYLVNGLVSHNSTFASSCLLYEIYRNGLIYDPINYYGLLSTTIISFVVMAPDFNLASDVNWSILEGFITESEFFKSIVKVPNAKGAPDELEFFPKITLRFATRPIHLVGRAILGGMSDESNVNRHIRKLYTDILNRIESRFPRTVYGGLYPGKLFNLSSPKDEGSFMAERVDANQKNALIITNRPIWEIKDRKLDLHLSDENFVMFIGSKDKEPFIVEPTSTITEDMYDYLIDVPVDYLERAEHDSFEFLREFAGVRTASKNQLWRTSVYIDKCFSKPNIIAEVLELNFDDPSDTIFSRFTETKGFTEVEDPYALRFVHIDVATRGDKLGIACSHAVEHEMTNVDSITGASTFTLRKIKEDFSFALKKPKDEEICIPKIIEFLMYLRRDLKYPIYLVSSDGHQGETIKQYMRLLSVLTEYVTLDSDFNIWKHIRSLIQQDLVEGFKNLLSFIEQMHLFDNGKTYDHPLKFQKYVQGTVYANAKGSHDLTQARYASFYKSATHPKMYSDSYYIAKLSEQRRDLTRSSYITGSKTNMINNYNKRLGRLF